MKMTNFRFSNDFLNIALGLSGTDSKIYLNIFSIKLFYLLRSCVKFYLLGNHRHYRFLFRVLQEKQKMGQFDSCFYVE